jgi:hypothetical protein
MPPVKKFADFSAEGVAASSAYLFRHKGLVNSYFIIIDFIFKGFN